MIFTTFGAPTVPGLLPAAHSRESQTYIGSHKYIFCLLCFFAMVVSLFLREDFLEVCGIIGSLVTIASSILLPIAFFHRLYRLSEITYARVFLHIFLIALAICAMFIGLVSSICGISHSHSSLCSYTTPSNAELSNNL